MTTDYQHDDSDLHDRGLQFDLATLMQRRHIFKLLGGGVALALVGCSDNGSTASGGSAAVQQDSAAGVATSTAAKTVSPIPTGTTPASACTGSIPQETAGPFPGDGTNGPNVLRASGVIRNDIRSSFGDSTTQAKGVPLDIELTIVDTRKNCAPLAGAAVYIWHCDMVGRYSMYGQGAEKENYLRGVQEAGADGKVLFKSVYPGAYSGRWPHVHFEVYPTLASASSSGNRVATSQLALPQDVCDKVYATTGYEQSAANMRQTTLANDMVFRDGVTLQMAEVDGSVASGYRARLVVGI